MADAPRAAPGRRWPVFQSLAGYAPSALGRDLIAGLTLAAIVIPEQMATAKLGGLPPQAGFFAFIAASLAFLVFGASRFMSIGADSTITPIFAGALAALAAAGSPQYPVLAAALAIMVGAAVTVAGAARMGWIANLLSTPVTTGFLAGIAIHIAVSQGPSALGLRTVEGALPQQIVGLARALGQVNPYAAGIAAGVVALTTGAHLLSARIPGALIGMVLATWAVIAFGLEARGVPVLGVIQGGLPGFAWPSVAPAQLLQLAPLALLIALVAMVQTGATSRAFPSDPDQAPDVNADYVGLGAGNLLAGLFGGFPVDASPPRTGVVAESGGRSQIAGLAAVLVVALLLAFGTGLLTHVPRAALSGVLLFVAARIFRVRDMRAVLMTSPSEFLLIVATAGAIVLLPIQSGAAIGIGLSLLRGMWSSVSPRSYRMHRLPGTTVWWPNAPRSTGETLAGVVVVGFQAPLSFLNADVFSRRMLAAIEEPGVTLVVLEATGVIDIDYTAGEAFKAVARRAAEVHVAFAVSRLEAPDAADAFRALGVIGVVGADHLFESVDQAIVRFAPHAAVVPLTAGARG